MLSSGINDIIFGHTSESTFFLDAVPLFNKKDQKIDKKKNSKKMFSSVKSSNSPKDILLFERR